MITSDLEAQILRLFHAEKWRMGTIANHLHIHRGVVQRVIHTQGKSRSLPRRPCLIDPYIPFVVETLRQYPRLTASRLHQMCRERGYEGKESQFRHHVSILRTAPMAEAYLRLRTLPGEQGQVDWGHFGRLEIGKASRPLMAFIMVLSYSRAIFAHFFLSQSLSNFLYGHQMACSWFGGVPRVCLYDNLKSVVLERTGLAIRFNPHFLQFAGHYRFEPRPVAIARGNEKGRVERAVRFLRTSFFAARRYKGLDDLNRQAYQWCEGTSLDRKWPEDFGKTVRQVFLEERKKLLSLPSDLFPCHERIEVKIGKTPYARFDLNDYSVPHALVRKTLVVVASLDTVRILDGNDSVAEHPRSYNRGRYIEDLAHLESLAQAKSAAGQHRRTTGLTHAVPSAKTLLERIAERGLPLGRATNELAELLRTHGPQELEGAIQEALDNGAPHTQAVRHILDRNQRDSGRRPALPLPLPDDPRVRDLTVKPHELESYDNIQEETDDDGDEKDLKS